MKVFLSFLAFLLLLVASSQAQLPGTFSPMMAGGAAALACEPNTQGGGTDANVVYLFHMEDGADSSLNGGALTLNGGATFSTAQAKFGERALGIATGSSDFAAVASAPANNIPIQGDFTIEFWVYFGGTPGTTIPTTWGAVGDNNTTFLSGADGSKYFMNIAAGGTVGSALANLVIQAGNWHHFAYVRQGTIGYMFVDGQLLPGANTATTTTQIANLTTAFWIGRSHTSYVLPNGSFIDEVRFSNVARYRDGQNFTPATQPFCDPPAIAAGACTANNQGGGSDANVVGLWHLDSRRDSGRNESDLTFNSTAGLSGSQAKFGGALAIGPTAGSFATAGTPNFIILSGDFTIESWVWFAAGQFGIYTGWFGDDNATWNTGPATNWTFGIRGTNATTGTAWQAQGITANTWIHVAFERHNGMFRVFVDGTEVSGSPATPPAAWITNILGQISSAFNIGRALASTYVMSANSFMDEVRVSDIARYTNNFTPQATPFCDPKPPPLPPGGCIANTDGGGTFANVLGLWHLDTNLNDSSGRGNDGVTIGTGGAGISSAQKKFGAGSWFGGTTALNGINIPNSALGSRDFNVRTGDFTWEAWGMLGAASTTQTSVAFFGSSNTSSGGDWYLGWNNTSTVSGYIGSTSYIPSWAFPRTAAMTNRWYHYAFVRQSGTMRLFVNGTEVPPAAANIVGDINEPATQTRIIGQYAGIAYSYGWTQGYLDEVRISNVARYTGNFTPPNAPFCNN